MVSKTPRPAAPRRLGALLLVLVSGASFLAFLPALDGQWLNWDDETNFVQNRGFRGLGPAQLKWMFTSRLVAVYIPLSWMTLGLNYLLGGMDPWGYHLGNLLLHAANAGLFYLVAARLLAVGFERPPESLAIASGAAAAALFFALHPLRVESVAWVTERRDVLCGVFYLLAVLAYLRAVAGGPRAGAWRGASLAAFAAALLSKGLTMTLPLTLLVLDVYPLGRLRAVGWRALVREKLPYLALSAIAAALALWAVVGEAKWTAYADHGPAARVAMMGYSVWFYPSRLVWPVGLSPLYELPARVTLSEWRFAGALLGVLAVTALLVAARRRWPAGLAAWAHSAIVVAPVSGLIHAGPQLAHDRFSYLSGLGFAVLVGAGAAWVGRRREERRIGAGVAAAAAAGGALALLGLASGTWEQSKIWLDSESLWEHAVGLDPDCALCQVNLGNVLFGQQRFREAELHHRRAIAVRPRMAEAHNNLGIALAAQRRHAEAEAAFQEALRLSPGLNRSLANLGALYAVQRRWSEALPLLRRAFRVEPNLPHLRAAMEEAAWGRAIELRREGHVGEAVALLREATGLRSADDAILARLDELVAGQGPAAERTR